ncbi:hypothetical protein C0995_007386 [Termitomyces sp. Mi166|nr:hypothetical protein C0995_007386 [Termitomyces sp. Mi166\
MVKSQPYVLIRALIRDCSRQQVQDWFTNIPDEWVNPSLSAEEIEEDKSESSERSEAVGQSVELTDDDGEDGSDTSSSDSEYSWRELTASLNRRRFTHYRDDTKLSAVCVSPGAQCFKALKTLKFDNCHFDDIDTTLLAAALHVRYTRHSPLQELSVQNSTHSSLTANRDVAMRILFALVALTRAE